MKKKRTERLQKNLHFLLFFTSIFENFSDFFSSFVFFFFALEFNMRIIGKGCMNTILYYILEERRILFKDLLLSLETRYSNGNAFFERSTNVRLCEYAIYRGILLFFLSNKRV